MNGGFKAPGLRKPVPLRIFWAELGNMKENMKEIGGGLRFLGWDSLCEVGGCSSRDM